MNRRVGQLPLPVRVLVFVGGLLLAFLAALAVGSVVALIVGGDGGGTATGSAESAAPETSSALTPETTTEAATGGETVPAAVTSFVHVATDDNSRGDYTYLSDPGIDGDPEAVVLVEPAPDEGTADDGAYDHNIGVWFEPQERKWAVFNQDIRPVPAGAAYRVTVPTEENSFVHRFSESEEAAASASASGSASSSASASAEPGINDTTLDDPLVNDKPEAQVSVTPNWNPGGGRGVHNNHPVDVRYDEGLGRWVIFNQDLAPLNDGAAFNVAVGGTDTDNN